MDSNIHENRSSSDEAFFTKQLANNLECVFWIAPPDLSKMLYISKGYEQIWGKTCESLYKKPKSFLDNVHKEDIKVVREHLKEMHHKGTFDHKYRIVKQTGEVRWVWDRGFPLKNEDGKIYQSIGIVLDITESKLREERSCNLIKTIKSDSQKLKKDIKSKNLALSEIIQQIEIQRESYKKAVTTNLRKVIFPIISGLMKKDPANINNYRLLEHNLNTIFSNFGIKVTGDKDLSPTEVEVCNFIRNGFRTKDIAAAMGIAVKTVENHRNSIRKKLGLMGSGKNLTAHLQEN
ncbi:MAG: PAS domain-containing protein [Nitrospina sp.]|jgi:PAS domain S-box-containing protein|nr:PAS domain-containing protein [Nitrospina sp.]MBT6740457.1 PAS domain-containing protein [Nitrospina sp.]MBT7682520.1 PAS domain-containing protein [Nitrospina sp.]